MEARAIAKYVRVSFRKIQPIAVMVRGKNVNEALAILKFTPNKGARVFESVIKSAKANAEIIMKWIRKSSISQKFMRTRDRT